MIPCFLGGNLGRKTFLIMWERISRPRPNIFEVDAVISVCFPYGALSLDVLPARELTQRESKSLATNLLWELRLGQGTPREPLQADNSCRRRRQAFLTHHSPWNISWILLSLPFLKYLGSWDKQRFTQLILYLFYGTCFGQFVYAKWRM